MDAASPERSRCGEAMADIPQEPSRSHCCDGLLHRPNAHDWCSVLLFVIGHERRKILHFNVTRNPNALWVVQQLREPWAYQQPDRFLLFDRDAKFGADVVSAVTEMGSQPTRTAFESPWQNGVAERWLGSCRRDLLDTACPVLGGVVGEKPTLSYGEAQAQPLISPIVPIQPFVNQLFVPRGLFPICP